VTPADLAAAARSITFTGGLKLWQPRFEVMVGPQGRAEWVSVELFVSVPERDGGPPSTLNFDRILPIDALGDFNMTAPELLRSLLLELVRHEVDEGILVDGVRLFDPHVERPR
jgi:hypothetical protein